MAINPFPRIQGLEIPTALPSGARAPEGTFANLASIGDAIGEYRTRNRLSEVAQGAIDPQTGALDIQKFASGAALAGIDPMRALALAEAARGRTTSENAQRALEAYHERTAREQERANRESERLRQLQLDQPTTTVVPPTLMNPGGAYTIPRDPTQPPVIRPFPNPTIGPQSALETPGPNLAAAEPNPEEAPPYRVAGPPMPPPQAPATAAPAAAAAAPAATPDRNEAFLQRLPPNAQTIVKGVANYEIDPATIQGKDREEVIAAAKTYRPDYNMTEYQKRGSPPSGEIAARIGLAKAFIERTPQIKERIQADELNSAGGRALAMVGQGGPGELRRAIDEGSEALLRGLTGAGMSANEATNYARRYQFSLIDTKDTQLRKLNELENALRYVSTEVLAGRGNEDLRKGFVSKFGEEVVPKAPVSRARNDAEVNRLVGQAKAAVKRDPAKADEVLRILQGRLPEGVDARRLLGQ
jgi:hypothetical protein